MCFRFLPLASTTLLALLAIGHATIAQVSPVDRTVLQIEEVASIRLVVFDGVVLRPDGMPAEGSVVVSSAGGRAVTARDGGYRFEARVPLDSDRVQVTAAGPQGTDLVVSTTVDLLTSRDEVQVDPLWLSREAGCQPSWLPTFGGGPGTDSAVNTLTVFDDGSGPALYAGGLFTIAGGRVVNHVAKWDGSGWTALGDGVDNSVVVLHVFDDGGGPALFAGGSFSNAGGVPASRIAKWDGSSWTAVGGGTSGTVQAMTVLDDGNGPALFAGGAFSTAGGVSASGVARWDGVAWSALGSGVNSQVNALAVWDDGSGPALFVGGGFTMAGGAPASRIARWDGASWTPLGSGMESTDSLPNASVLALTVFDDGGGSALYAGGGFTTAGGVAARYIARWDGVAWSAIGGGMNYWVEALTVHDDGSESALYVGGEFSIPFGHIQKWNGSTWTALGSGVNSIVYDLAEFDDGSGSRLYVGGVFGLAGVDVHDDVHNIAAWNGTDWEPLDAGGVGSTIDALAVFDDGSGPALHAGGEFRVAGGVAVNRIARWDGSSWTALGSGMNASVLALTVFDDGNGPALIAGGYFTIAGGMAANRVAKWDGVAWTPLGSGLSDYVSVLAVYDDGGGPALIAGGAPNQLSRWDGVAWGPLRVGVSGVNGAVNALAVFDEGVGPALFVGGHFSTAGGAPASNIARWNGSSWSTLGSGVGSTVESLAVLDDGTGPSLYVGGRFLTAGGAPANRIARWDGSSWTTLGDGTDNFVASLAVFDDGSGPALHAGGRFLAAGGVAASQIAKWDGSSWTPLGSGMLYGPSSSIRALATFDAGGGPSLFAGGHFWSAIDSEDSFVARWAGCPDLVPPVLSCADSVRVFGSPSGRTVHFTVTATDNLDSDPTVVCMPPSGSLFPPGTTLVTCSATDSEGNEATCQFPVTVEVKIRPR